MFVGTIGVDVVVVVVATLFFNVRAIILQLPDTTGIDGQLTANKSIDQFFSLWLVFNNDDEVQISDKPFTIFAPKNSLSTNRTKIIRENLLQQPELVKKLLLDHVILGTKLDLNHNNLVADISLPTLSGRTIKIRANNANQANNVTILEKNIKVPNGTLIIVENYLFPYDEEQPPVKEVVTLKSLIPSSSASILSVRKEVEKIPSSNNNNNTTFVENVLEVLSFLKSRVRVFQHFVSRSNVSKLLKEDEEYTVFVPTDHAFQRWHPIDWGFYPFSVPEFTESVIVNHFVKGRLKQDTIKDGQVVKTLGGREIHFKRTPSLLTGNGANIVKGDTPVDKGNIMFIGEVLFVSEAIVSKLHQQHRDKETPPLLAFPWFGAQFLSHAFLALERNKRFTHITRFLNLADLAPHVSGAGYTFFVPTDTAFEELGLDKMPDNYLSNSEGLQVLLNHFVQGRLYDRDLKNGIVLRSLGTETLYVNRTEESIQINEAEIVESEVFVYNLGTMFYIDKILYNTVKIPPILNVPDGCCFIPNNPTTPRTTTDLNFEFTYNSAAEEFTTNSLAEKVVEESTREFQTDDDGVEHEPEVLLDATDNTGVEFTTLGSSIISQNISYPK